MFPPASQNQAQVTGNDDFDAFVRTAIEQEVSKRLTGTPGATPPAAAPTAAPAPINVNIGGQAYSFNTAEELSAAMNQTLGQYQAALQAHQAPAAAATSGRTVTGDDSQDKKHESPVDIKAFIDKMGENPIEAFNMVDKARFGVDNPAELIRNMAKAITDQQRVMASYQFRDAHPEYKGTMQNAQAIDGIMRQLNLPFTADGLEAAHALALKRGLIAADEQNVQQPQQQPAYQQPYQAPSQQQFAAQQNPFLAPPPRAGRSASAPAPDLSAQADELSSDQIEAIFARFQ